MTVALLLNVLYCFILNFINFFIELAEFA
jgi:hypothetical protein